jgi:hypothetical protein
VTLPAAADTTEQVTVSANALLVAYSHLGLLRLLNDGWDRRTAFLESARWFFHRLLPAAGQPLATGVAVTPDEETAEGPYSVECLVRSARMAPDALACDWDAWRVREPSANSAVIDTALRDRLLVLEDLVLRVGQGGQLYESARQAVDAAAGRPRQRRAPLDRQQVAGMVSAVAEPARLALLAARRPSGRPFIDPGKTGVLSMPV